MDKKFEIQKDFSEYKKVFLEENAKLNLISKKDEKFLYEKHIYVHEHTHSTYVHKHVNQAYTKTHENYTHTHKSSRFQLGSH